MPLAPIIDYSMWLVVCEILRRQKTLYLKMLIQAVGVPVLELSGVSGALARRGGLRLLHPWNTNTRAFRHAAAEAVAESRQHGYPRGAARRALLYYPNPGDFATFTRRRFVAADEDEERLFLPRAASPSRKWRLSRGIRNHPGYTYP